MLIKITRVFEWFNIIFFVTTRAIINRLSGLHLTERDPARRHHQPRGESTLQGTGKRKCSETIKD